MTSLDTFEAINNILTDLKEQEDNYIEDEWRKYYQLQHFNGHYLQIATYTAEQRDLIISHATLYISRGIEQVRILIKSISRNSYDI